MMQRSSCCREDISITPVFFNTSRSSSGCELKPAHEQALPCVIVTAYFQTNHVSIQTLCTYMCPSLGVSQNLLAYLVGAADKLFPDIRLAK